MGLQRDGHDSNWTTTNGISTSLLKAFCYNIYGILFKAVYYSYANCILFLFNLLITQIMFTDFFKVKASLTYQDSMELSWNRPSPTSSALAPLWSTCWISLVQFSCSVMVRLFATPWTAARQASLSITKSRSLLKLMFRESVMPSNHLILCRTLVLPPSVFPSIRVFSNESVLRIRWPKYWSFSFSISLSNEYSRLISFRVDWLVSLQSKGLSRVFSSTKF